MWFPHPMVEHKFNNEYDVIICALYLTTGLFREGRSAICCTMCLVAGTYHRVYRDINLLSSLQDIPFRID